MAGIPLATSTVGHGLGRDDLCLWRFPGRAIRVRAGSGDSIATKGTASERDHLKHLLSVLPSAALVVCDAGYTGYDLCAYMLKNSVDFLIRMSSTVTLYTLEMQPLETYQEGETTQSNRGVDSPGSGGFLAGNPVVAGHDGRVASGGVRGQSQSAPSRKGNSPGVSGSDRTATQAAVVVSLRPSGT